MFLFFTIRIFFSPSLTTHPNVRYQLLMFHEPSTIKWRTYGKLRLCCRSCLRHFSILSSCPVAFACNVCFESSFNVLKCIKVCSSFQFFFFVFFSIAECIGEFHMERDFSYQKLLFGTVFMLVFFIMVTHKIAWIQFHCE